MTTKVQAVISQSQLLRILYEKRILLFSSFMYNCNMLIAKTCETSMLPSNTVRDSRLGESRGSNSLKIIKLTVEFIPNRSPSVFPTLTKR